MIKKKIPTPLTETQLKEKIKSAAAIAIPKYAQGIKITKEGKKNKDFSRVSISGVGHSVDQIGVDGTGKEHRFPGGSWMAFNWAIPGFGFGELSIRSQNDGKIVIDSERLGKDFVKAMLCDLVDKAEVK